MVVPQAITLETDILAGIIRDIIGDDDDVGGAHPNSDCHTTERLLFQHSMYVTSTQHVKPSVSLRILIDIVVGCPVETVSELLESELQATLSPVTWLGQQMKMMKPRRVRSDTRQS